MVIYLVALGVLLSICRGGLVQHGVDYVGRFDAEKRAEWPGSGIRLSLRGLSRSQPVSVDVKFGECKDYCNYYVSVYLDCVQREKFLITDENMSISYTFRSNGEHHLREISFIKVTEASADTSGQMQIVSVDVEHAVVSPAFESQCNATGHKLLFLGDSLTVALGVDGIPPCDFSGETEDVTHGYAFLVAHSLKADVHVVAMSGHGVVRNFADPVKMSALPLPAYYNRTLVNLGVSNNASANYWHPSRYQADVVVVMLGANDFSTEPRPTDEQFTDGLVAFLRQIHVDYPQANVLAVCSSYATWPSQCPSIEKATRLTNSAYLFLSPSVYNDGWGCGRHPSRITQQNMADVVLPAVHSLLKKAWGRERENSLLYHESSPSATTHKNPFAQNTTARVYPSSHNVSTTKAAISHAVPQNGTALKSFSVPHGALHNATNTTTHKSKSSGRNVI